MGREELMYDITREASGRRIPEGKARGRWIRHVTPPNTPGTGNREIGPGSCPPHPTQLASWAHLASWGPGTTGKELRPAARGRARARARAGPGREEAVQV